MAGDTKDVAILERRQHESAGYLKKICTTSSACTAFSKLCGESYEALGPGHKGL